MSGAETEGVTKFYLDFRQAPPVEARLIAPLNVWRTVLHRLDLISQDARRYGGVGFGNVSLRTPAAALRASASLFVVSGTQTGALERLTAWHYCRVLDYDLSSNSLTAEGPVPPSSESLTHAAVYRAAPWVQCVIHVHSPEIWRCAEALGLPVVDARISYGTPAMANAVGALVRRGTRNALLAMGGHEDGIVAYGAAPDETALNLIRWFARALEMSAAESPPKDGDCR